MPLEAGVEFMQFVMSFSQLNHIVHAGLLRREMEAHLNSFSWAGFTI